MRTNLVERIERDILLSLRSATVRTLLPVALYAALYPWLLSAMGTKVFGLWSLFTSAPAMSGLFDLGIPQLLSRQTEDGSGRGNHVNIVADTRSAELIYVLIVMLVSVVISAVVFYSSLIPSVQPYSLTDIVINVWIMGLAIIAYLSARIHGAVLTSRHENYNVHLGFTLQPTLTAGCTAAGLLFNKPIEGFSVGLFFSSLVLRRWFIKTWSKKMEKCSGLDRPRGRLKILVRESKGLYAANAALSARDPLLRLIIASSGGLAAVAAYEVASRVTRIIRDLVSAPFSALLAGFSALWADGGRVDILRISSTSIASMVTVGGGLFTLAAAGFAICGDSWLRSAPEGILGAIVVLSTWHLLTLLNTPYWNLLLATKQEGAALRAVLVHTLSLALLAPLFIIFKVRLSTILLFWLTSSFITQHLIFSAAAKTLTVPYLSLFTPRLSWPLLELLTFCICAGAITVIFAERQILGLMGLSVSGVIYFAVLHYTLRRQNLHPMGFQI